MYRYIKKNSGLFLIVVLLIFVFAIAELGKAYFMGELLNVQLNLSKIIKLIGVVILFLLIYVIVSSMKDYFIQKFENKVRYDIQRNIYCFTIQDSPEEFLKKDSSFFINQMVNKTNEIIEKYIHSRISMINLVISFLIGSIYIGMNSIAILIFLYCCAGLCLACNKYFSSPLEKSQKTLLMQKEKWIKATKNFFKNFLYIKNENYEENFIKLLDRENDNLKSSYNKANGLLMVSDAVNGGLGQYMFIGTIIIGALLIHTGHLNVPKVLAISQVTNMVVNPIFQFATLKNRILSSRFLLEEMEAEEQRVLEHNKRETISLPALRSITLDHLDFAYPNGKTVFHDVSHTFKQGSKTLIVGPSGEGKSTLLKLLLKQIPSSNVKADGAPLDQVRYGSYFSHIAYVSQTLSLFPMTLKENIVLGKDKPVEPVLKQVRLMDLNDRQNEVFDSDSMTLSGGQIQRVVLGRAIASDKEWVVLDEAFSAIDEATRQSIEMAFLNDPAKTVIAVSHHIDPDVAARYDEILLVKNGTLRPITLEALKEEMKKRW